MYMLGNKQTLHQFCVFFPIRHPPLQALVPFMKSGIRNQGQDSWCLVTIQEELSPLEEPWDAYAFTCHVCGNIPHVQICANIPYVQIFHLCTHPTYWEFTTSPLSLEVTCGALRPAAFVNLRLLQQEDPSLNCSLPSVHRECIWNCSVTLPWEITIGQSMVNVYTTSVFCLQLPQLQSHRRQLLPLPSLAVRWCHPWRYSCELCSVRIAAVPQSPTGFWEMWSLVTLS